MVENEERFFVDRRTDEEKQIGLATPIRYWYDVDKKKRRRTNGVAVTLEGEIVVARSSCSRKDQFARKYGRFVVARRIEGRELAARENRKRGRKHCWIILEGVEGYRQLFPGDEAGAKRTYNAVRVYKEYKAAIEARAQEVLDDIELGR